MASRSVRDSAASLPTGVAVAESSRSQVSLVLAAPSSVASSVTAERDRRSHSHGIGKSTGARSSQSSPSRGRDSCEERRRACSRSGGVA